MCCISGKNGSTENVAPDSTVNVPSNTTEEEEEENINDEDHGDPGLAGLIIDPAALEPEVKTFLASLTREKLNIVVPNNQDVLLVEPGPGVSPTYRFLKSSNELVEVDELMLYLSDSSALHPSTFYRMVYDPCQIIEGMPEGTYLRDVDFRDLTFTDSDDSVNQKLQRFISEKQSDSGVEMLIKFSSKTDDTIFLHLISVKQNGQLFLAIIDQRDCGA